MPEQDATIKKLPLVPKRSLVYFLMCAAGIIIFIFAGIYPNKKMLENQHIEARSIKDKIREQEILVPLLKDLLKKTYSGEDGFSTSETERITFEDVGNVPSIFQAAAQKSGLVFTGCEPDLSALQNGSNILLVNLSLEGDFYKFRIFLFSICKMLWLDSIDTIQIRSGVETREFMLKLRLTIE